MSDVLETHKEGLNSICRLCNGIVNPKKRYQKTKFLDEIIALAGINVLNETEEIHPQFVCNICSRNLYRYRIYNIISDELNSVTPNKYEPHTADCEICRPKVKVIGVKGRPRKKIKGDIMSSPSVFVWEDQLDITKHPDSLVEDPEYPMADMIEDSDHQIADTVSISSGDNSSFLSQKETVMEGSHTKDGIAVDAHMTHEPAIVKIDNSSTILGQIYPNSRIYEINVTPLIQQNKESNFANSSVVIDDIAPQLVQNSIGLDNSSKPHDKKHCYGAENDESSFPGEYNPCSMDEKVVLKDLNNLILNTSNSQLEGLMFKLLDILTPDAVSILVNCLGRKQRKDIAKDADTFFLLYKDMDAMSDFNISRWLLKRDETVLAYLLGLCGNGLSENIFTTLESIPNDLLLISRAMEQLYGLCSRKLVSPISFLIGLTAYAFTGSRVLVDMIGNTSPSGRYKVITNWLRDQGSEPTVYPVCDLLNVFDNEQVVGKTYTIKPRNKVTVSVITNKGFVSLHSEENLQVKPDLKPEIRLKLTDEADYVSEADIQNKEKLKNVLHAMIDQSSEEYRTMETEHNEQLYHFINHAIEAVLQDQTLKNQDFEDSIDSLIQKNIQEENYITCKICQTVNGKLKRVCTGCGERDGLKEAKALKKTNKTNQPKKQEVQKIIFEQGDEKTKIHTEFTQFDHVLSNHQGKHELILTDPVFCNPNSSASIARVLRKIGEENDIVRYGGRKRHWTFICCDGLPYMIIKKLKEQAVICAHIGCNKSFLTIDDYNKHANQSHPDEPKKFVYEFDWFYLRIGLGHYEMNLIKSFFELNWIPFLEAMCEEMGFETDASKQFAKGCKDHHKSWRLLLTFHLGCIQELVLPYVRFCLHSKLTPTAKGFMGYNANLYSSGKNPNLTYLMDQVCKYSQGIINLRMATRRNNASLLRSAKYMTKELFHGRQHPKYQIIELYDTIQYSMMPKEVRLLNDNYTSITTSGNSSLGEDFDFVLEEKNKQLKSWIPKGVPTDEIWQTVCRNNKLLENIKGHSLNIFGVSSSKGGTQPLCIDDAITAFRVLLRQKNYIYNSGDHTSLSGTALDEGLINFTQEALGKRIHILKTEFLGLPVKPEHYIFKHPVPITPFEREKLYSTSNMTVKQLQDEISKCLDKISDPFQMDYHNNLYQQEVRTKGKTKLLQFLQEVKTALQRDSPDLEYDDSQQ